MKKSVTNSRKINENLFAKIFLYFVGALLLLFGILAWLNSFIIGNYSQVFWFCYLGLILIGFGVLLRKGELVLSQLNILIIPTIIWNMDFFYRLYTGNEFLGITNYFFDYSFSLSSFVSLVHVFGIPLVLAALFFIKVKRKDFWKISIVQVLLIFGLSYIFTDEKVNVNCALKSCFDLPFDFSIAVYPFIWIFFVLIMIFLTNFFLTRIFIRK